jgi:hypothetical protein
MIHVADQILEFSDKVGGARNVYEGHINLLVGGFMFDKSELPAYPWVLPAGTPIKVDEQARTIKIHYAFEVAEAVTAGAKVKVKKGFEGSRVKAGMFLMVAPEDADTAGTGIKVNSVVTTNDDFDEVTLASDPGELSAGAVLVEADKSGETAKIKSVPNALTDRDKRLAPDAKSINGDAVWACDRPILERRIPPIAPAIKKALRDADCFFRFSNRK